KTLAPETAAPHEPVPDLHALASVAVLEDLRDAVATFNLAPPDPLPAPMTLWATFYYVPQFKSQPRGFAMRTLQGRPLGPRLERAQWCEAAMQGSVSIEGFGIVNYAGTRRNLEVDCRSIYPRHPAIGRSRFVIVEGDHGLGIGRKLLAHRSLAVDPDTVPMGAAVFIPAARGVEIAGPSETTFTHDGWFFAADRGGAIRGTHVDVFMGFERTNPFSFVNSREEPGFVAHVIEEGPVVDALRGAHEPPP
ncbi:MAG: 3D domain-containing protein, partial [Myxococcota bacterium]